MKKYPFKTINTAIFIALSFPTVALSHEAGDFILRVGAVSVAPDETSSLKSTVNTGALPGTKVGVGDDTQAGFNIVYMLTDNIGAEVLASTSFQHDLNVIGLEQFGFATRNLGTTDQLPPTLTLNYYFGNANSKIRPYLGLGVNYTGFFQKSLSNQARNDLGASGLNLENSFGVAYRAGIDWSLGDNWMLNASMWQIDLDTEISFDSNLGRVTADLNKDPWIYMLSLGYRF